MPNPGAEKFDGFLRRWNRGIYRGAASRLARKLNVGRSAVSGWRNGTIRPSEQKMNELADTFGVEISEIESCFPKGPSQSDVYKMIIDRLDQLERKVDSMGRRKK